MKENHNREVKSKVSFSALYRYTAAAVIIWAIVIAGLLAWDINNENSDAIEL